MKRVQGLVTAGVTGSTGGTGIWTFGGLTAGLGVPAPLGAVPPVTDVGDATRPGANNLGDTAAKVTGVVLAAPTKLTCLGASAVATLALLTLPVPTINRW